MTAKTKPFFQIEMTAENLLNNCGCFDNPAENIDIMINSCKIDIIPLDTKDTNFCGCLGIDKNDNKFIGFNKNMIKERILFTKAHELGHFVLNHKLKCEFLKELKFNQKDPQETEANVFAAALLMPKQKVIKEMNKTFLELKLDLQNLIFNELDEATKMQIRRHLHSIFGTSFQAIDYRINNILIKLC